MDRLRSIGAPLRRLCSKYWPWADPFSSPQALGDWGERQAARYLRRHGYKILIRNFRVPRGEIDLVCRHDASLVFVEVKTRQNELRGRPAEAVNFRKRERMRHAAKAYLKQLKHLPPFTHRHDIVEVIASPGRKPEIRLIQQLEMNPK